MEHILQSTVEGKEFQSLQGKNYDVEDKRLIISRNPSVYADILSSDVCYADNNGKHFKRMFINNCLDPRF